MILISHRGNTNGPKPELENNPKYIKESLTNGFHVEVDVWKLEDKLYLGHDSPEYLVDLKFLDNNMLWCHCKNIEALEFLLNKDVRCFFHDSDDTTLTHDGYMWTYPGKLLTKRSICVMPEKDNWNIPEYVAGVCSDYIELLKKDS